MSFQPQEKRKGLSALKRSSPPPPPPPLNPDGVPPHRHHHAFDGINEVLSSSNEHSVFEQERAHMLSHRPGGSSSANPMKNNTLSISPTQQTENDLGSFARWKPLEGFGHHSGVVSNPCVLPEDMKGNSGQLLQMLRQRKRMLIPTALCDNSVGLTEFKVSGLSPGAPTRPRNSKGPNTPNVRKYNHNNLLFKEEGARPSTIHDAKTTDNVEKHNLRPLSPGKLHTASSTAATTHPHHSSDLNKEGRPMTRQKQPKEALDLFGSAHPPTKSEEPFPPKPSRAGGGRRGDGNGCANSVPSINFGCLFVNNDDEFAPSQLFPSARRRGSNNITTSTNPSERFTDHNIPLIETDWVDFVTPGAFQSGTTTGGGASTSRSYARGGPPQQAQRQWVEISPPLLVGPSTSYRDSSDSDDSVHSLEHMESVKKYESLYDLLVQQKGGVGLSPTNFAIGTSGSGGGSSQRNSPRLTARTIKK